MPRKKVIRKAKAAASRLILPQRLRLLHGGFPTEPNERQMEGLKAQWTEHRDTFFGKGWTGVHRHLGPCFRPWGYLEFELKPEKREGESLHDTLTRLEELTFAERKAIPGWLKATPWEPDPYDYFKHQHQPGHQEREVRSHLKRFLRPGEDPKDCVVRLLK
ncbi:MAG: hypothetical protein V3T83_06440 [Acidobacteriota bacterium]